MHKLTQLPANIAITGIRAYKLLISPWLGSNCRFTPTCSQYAIEAYQRFGLIKGSWLSLKRIAKCHPWHPGGLDEVDKHDSKGEHPNKHKCSCAKRLY